jgi:acyl-coenzyme A thioesterase PaaI-like protein
MMHRNVDEPAKIEALAREALAARGLPVRLPPDQRQRWQDEFNRIPGMRYMGCRLDLSDGRVIAVHLPKVEPHHQGGLGTDAVNGAVLAGFFDVALGVAGVLQFPGRQSGTVELSIKFMRPTVGDSLIAYAVALKRSENLAFVESELYSANRLCALATGMVATTASSA